MAAKKKPKKKKPSNYLRGIQQPGKELRGIFTAGTRGLLSNVNKALEAAGRTGQNIAQMNLGEAQTSLLGSGDQRGLVGLLSAAQRQYQDATSAGQRQQITDIRQGAQGVRGALNQLSPEIERATGLFGRAATVSQRLAQPTQQMTARGLEQQAELSRRAMGQALNYEDPTKKLANGAISGFQGIAGLQQRAAEDAYSRSKQLSPEQLRESQQMARESFASRGMLGSTGSVAAEILNREASMASRRAEAAGMGQLAQQGQQGLVGLSSGYESDRLARQQQMRNQAMGLSQAALGTQQSVRGEARQATGDLYDAGQYYSQYGLPLLTQQTGAQQAGMGLLSAGLGMSGQGSGLLQSGVNLGMAKYTTDQEAAAARQAANASSDAGMFGGIGSAIGGLASFFSDIRLKDNLRHIGDFKGLPAFEWDWNGEAPNPTQPAIGFIAQMVQERFPNLVKTVDGYLTIDYPSLFRILGTSFDELRDKANQLKG